MTEASVAVITPAAVNDAAESVVEVATEVPSVDASTPADMAVSAVDASPEAELSETESVAVVEALSRTTAAPVLEEAVSDAPVVIDPVADSVRDSVALSEASATAEAVVLSEVAVVSADVAVAVSTAPSLLYVPVVVADSKGTTAMSSDVVVVVVGVSVTKVLTLLCTLPVAEERSERTTDVISDVAVTSVVEDPSPVSEGTSGTETETDVEPPEETDTSVGASVVPELTDVSVASLVADEVGKDRLSVVEAPTGITTPELVKVSAMSDSDGISSEVEPATPDVVSVVEAPTVPEALEGVKVSCDVAVDSLSDGTRPPVGRIWEVLEPPVVEEDADASDVPENVAEEPVESTGTTGRVTSVVVDSVESEVVPDEPEDAVTEGGVVPEAKGSVADVADVESVEPAETVLLPVGRTTSVGNDTEMVEEALVLSTVWVAEEPVDPEVLPGGTTTSVSDIVGVLTLMTPLDEEAVDPEELPGRTTTPVEDVVEPDCAVVVLSPAIDDPAEAVELPVEDIVDAVCAVVVSSPSVDDPEADEPPVEVGPVVSGGYTGVTGVGRDRVPESETLAAPVSEDEAVEGVGPAGVSVTPGMLTVVDPAPGGKPTSIAVVPDEEASETLVPVGVGVGTLPVEVGLAPLAEAPEEVVCSTTPGSGTVPDAVETDTVELPSLPVSPTDEVPEETPGTAGTATVPEGLISEEATPPAELLPDDELSVTPTSAGKVVPDEVGSRKPDSVMAGEPVGVEPDDESPLDADEDVLSEDPLSGPTMAVVELLPGAVKDELDWGMTGI